MLSLSPGLTTYIASLSVLTGCISVEVGPPVDRVWFDFFCLSPIAAGVAVLGWAVSVSPWDVKAAPTYKAGHLFPLVIIGVVTSDSYR